MLKKVIAAGSAPAVYRTEYRDFRGVDFSKDATQVDRFHAPFAKNLISDGGGFPEKRLGFRALWQVEKPVNGLFCTVLNQTSYFIVHGGTKLYHIAQGGTPTVISSGVANKRSVGFTVGNKLWILTGRDYLVFDGVDVRTVASVAYIPTTVISRAPSGGGTAYENLNLLSKWQKNSFLSDGSAKIYCLNRAGLDADAISVTVDGVEKTESVDFSVNRATGKITFVTIPPKPAVSGQDNVIVTFAKTTPGYRERIEACDIAALYGGFCADRVFVSGNEGYKNYDWHSGLSDPSYFPDLNYSVIGTSNTAIMGYHKIGAYLAILKQDSQNDSTIFLREATINEVFGEKQTVFPIRQAVTGVGAIAKKSFGTLLDEPLFLSKNGIYGITSSNITAEKTVKNRSLFINSQLTKEKNPERICCAEWNGLFLICAAPNCYVLDGRQQKAFLEQDGGSYAYEAFYWENIPAVCFLEQQGVLYFGTENGEICRFNSDIETMARFNDNGEAIAAGLWTKADDDGDFLRYKTMRSSGCGVMIKPYTRSSCTVYVKTNGDFGRKICSSKMDMLDFNDVDFTRFTFHTNDSPQVIPLKTRVKDYITLQFYLENKEKNEGFGVFGVVKRFTKGGYVKK